MFLLFESNINGYFHNDINLNNILIDNNLEPVFIDYSFSKKIIKNKGKILCLFLLTIEAFIFIYYSITLYTANTFAAFST